MVESTEGGVSGPSLYEQFMKLWRQSSAYLLGSAANRAIAIILIPMYTRYLTPDDYGVFAIVIATVGFISVIMKLGMPGAFVRFYVDVDEESPRGEVLSTSLLFTVFWALLVLFILLPLTGPLGKNLLGREDLGMLFLLAFSSAMVDAVSAILLSRFRARGNARRYVLFTLARFTIGVTLNIFFVAFLGRGVRGIFEAGIISSTITLVALVPISLGELSRRVRLDLLRSMLRYSVPLVPASLAVITLFYTDRLFLQFFRTSSEVGLYNLGYNIGLAINLILVSPLSLAWGPLAFSAYRDRESATRLYSRALTYYAAIGSLLCLVFSLLARSAVVFLATPSFYDSSQVVPLISISYFLSGSVIVLGTGIRLAKKTSYIAITHVSAAFLNIALNYLLVPPYGMMGAAATSMASYLFIAIVIQRLSSRFLSIKYETGRLLKIALATVLTATVGLLLSPSNPVVEAILRFLALAVFPLVLLASSFFTVDEKIQMKKFILHPWKVIRES